MQEEIFEFDDNVHVEMTESKKTIQQMIVEPMSEKKDNEIYHLKSDLKVEKLLVVGIEEEKLKIQESNHQLQLSLEEANYQNQRMQDEITKLRLLLEEETARRKEKE